MRDTDRLPDTEEQTTATLRTPHRPCPALLASQVNGVAEKEVELFFSKLHAGASGDAREAVARRIATLSEHDRDALSLYFDPEPWPESMRRQGVDYPRGYALVLAHAAPYKRWPDVPQRRAYLRRASVQLEAAVAEHGPRVLDHLVRRAEWNFAAAMRAYVGARGRVPPAFWPASPDAEESP